MKTLLKMLSVMFLVSGCLSGSEDGSSFSFESVAYNLMWSKISPKAGAEDVSAFGGSDAANPRSARIGDVNSDGFEDFAVGSPKEGNANLASAPGLVYVISGQDGSVLFSLTGENAADRFGASVAGPGDIDGDGTPDILISASHIGKVYLYSGATHGLLWSEVQNGTQRSTCYGSAIAPAGDFNNDGRPDLLIGDPCYSSNKGSAWIISGSDYSVLNFVTGATGGDSFGQLVASNPATRTIYVLNCAQGQVLAYSNYSGYQGPSTPPTATISEIPSSVRSIALAGDIDGDSVSDLILTAQRYVKVYSGADLHLIHKVTHPQLADYWVSAVGIGDWDHDGFNDFAATVSQPTVMVFSGKTGQSVGIFSASSGLISTGALVDAIDYDGAGSAAVLLVTNRNYSTGSTAYSIGDVRLYKAP